MEPMNFILLVCPICCEHKLIELDSFHPAGTEVEVQKCPGCWDGDFDESEYFDGFLNPIDS